MNFIIFLLFGRQFICKSRLPSDEVLERLQSDIKVFSDDGCWMNFNTKVKKERFFLREVFGARSSTCCTEGSVSKIDGGSELKFVVRVSNAMRFVFAPFVAYLLGISIYQVILNGEILSFMRFTFLLLALCCLFAREYKIGQDRALQMLKNLLFLDIKEKRSMLPMVVKRTHLQTTISPDYLLNSLCNDNLELVDANGKKTSFKCFVKGRKFWLSKASSSLDRKPLTPVLEAEIEGSDVAIINICLKFFQLDIQGFLILTCFYLFAIYSYFMMDSPAIITLLVMIFFTGIFVYSFWQYRQFLKAAKEGIPNLFK